MAVDSLKDMGRAGLVGTGRIGKPNREAAGEVRCCFPYLNASAA